MGVSPYNINSVKDYLILKDKEHQCELLSSNYVRGNMPLKFRCNLCNQEFERSFYQLKNMKNNFACSHCNRTLSHQEYKLIDVQHFLTEKDIEHECTLLSKRYSNIRELLDFQCNICGKQFQRSFQAVRTATNFCCLECSKCKTGIKNTKYTEEIVKQMLEEDGCILLEPYRNITTKVKCKCSKGHIFDFVLSHYLRKQQPCIFCSYEARRGPGSPNWKHGGNQETADLLRHSINDWKIQVMKKYDYKCDISNKQTSDLVIHHVNKNFSQIIDEAHKNLGIPFKIKIKDYSNAERDKLIAEVQRLHTIDNGVVLTAYYHKKFHQRYGTHNNTLEQYLEFKTQMQNELLNSSQ